MDIITNEKTIRRNAGIGKYTLIAAIALWALGLYLSYQFQDVKFLEQNQAYSWVMIGSLFVGFILFQVSTYFTNRFGRRPRPDELLAASLKGFSKDYSLYHYMTPVSHLLVGPAGVWVIEPYYQRGKISYEKERWQQKGGGFMLWYMKIFAQEGLGRPDLEIKADIDSLNEEFKKVLGDDAPPVHAVLVFTDPRTEIAADDAPCPSMKVKELKEFLRKYAKEHPFSAEQIERVTAVLPDEGVE